MNIVDELQKLQSLRQSGAITDEECTQIKDRILSGQIVSGSQKTNLNNLEIQTRKWAFFLHLSVITCIVIPFFGLLAPIIIWNLKKHELPGIDAHGKNMVNWIASFVIYFVLSYFFLLMAEAPIGLVIVLLVALFAGLVFPIVAAIKANNGEIWKYPFSITFLK